MKTLPGIIISILILASLLYLAMYFSTNSATVEVITKGGSPTPSPIEGLEDGSINAEDIDNDQITSPEITDVAIKYLVFFIDKNLNANKDDGEMWCPYCKNTEFIMGLENSKANPTLIKTDSNSKIEESKMAGNNMIWGMIPDKSALINSTKLAFGDGTSDVMIPIWEYSGIIAGVNANIENVSVNGSEVEYKISKLVPIMKTAYESQKPIILKITPNSESLKIFFTARGSIRTSNDGSFYTVSVDDSRAISSVGQISKIEFIVF